MKSVLYRADGLSEVVLNQSIRQGVVKTNAEAIRAALLEWGKYHGLIPVSEAEGVARRFEQYRLKLDAGKTRNYSLDEVMSENGITRADLEELDDDGVPRDSKRGRQKPVRPSR